MKRKEQNPKHLFPPLPPPDDPTVTVWLRLHGVERVYVCDWFSPEEHDYLIYNNIVEDFGVSPVDFETLAAVEIVAEKGDEIILLRFDPETLEFKTSK